MKDVMIDLETFGHTNNSVIVQLAGVYFDRHTGETGPAIKLNVDARDELVEGFEVTGSTLYWWLKQGESARLNLSDPEPIGSRPAIETFNTFIGEADSIWSHATFDFVILMNHLDKLGIKPSFSFRAARDLRTLVDLADFDYKSEADVGVKHCALDDCLYQIRYAVKCIKSLGK